MSLPGSNDSPADCSNPLDPLPVNLPSSLAHSSRNPFSSENPIPAQPSLPIHFAVNNRPTLRKLKYESGAPTIKSARLTLLLLNCSPAHPRNRFSVMGYRPDATPSYG